MLVIQIAGRLVEITWRSCQLHLIHVVDKWKRKFIICYLDMTSNSNVSQML